MNRDGTGRFHGAQRYIPRRMSVGERWVRGYSSAFIDAGLWARKLLPGDSAALLSTSLFAGLLVMGVLFQLAQDAALLKLLIEALQRGINRFI